MYIHGKKLEEKVRDIGFTNLAIERVIHYSNIYCDYQHFFKDNGISDFAIINSFNKTRFVNTSNNDIYL